MFSPKLFPEFTQKGLESLSQCDGIVLSNILLIFCLLKQIDIVHIRKGILVLF